MLIDTVLVTMMSCVASLVLLMTGIAAGQSFSSLPPPSYTSITTNSWTSGPLVNCYADIYNNNFKPVDGNDLGRTVYGGMIKDISMILTTPLLRSTTVDDAKVYSCMLNKNIDKLLPNTMMETKTSYKYIGREVSINTYALPMFYTNIVSDDTTSQGLACWYKVTNGSTVTADSGSMQCGAISVPSRMQTRVNVYRNKLPVRARVDMYVNNTYTSPNNESVIDTFAYASLDALAVTTINKKTYTLLRNQSLGGTYDDIAQNSLCKNCKDLSVSNVSIRLIGKVAETPPCLGQMSVMPMLYTYGSGYNRMHCIASINGYSLYSMDRDVASILIKAYKYEYPFVMEKNTSKYLDCNPEVETAVLMTPFWDSQYQGFKFVTLNNYNPAIGVSAKHITNIAFNEVQTITVTHSISVAISIIMEHFDEWNRTSTNISSMIINDKRYFKIFTHLAGTNWIVNKMSDFSDGGNNISVLKPKSVVLPLVSNAVDMGTSCRDEGFGGTNLDFGPDWAQLNGYCRTYGQDTQSSALGIDSFDSYEVTTLIDELASNMTQANNRKVVLDAIGAEVAPVLVTENGATWSTIIALTIGSIGSVTVTRGEWMPWYVHLLLQCGAIWVPVGTGLYTLARLSGVVKEFIVWDHVWGSTVSYGNTVSTILVHVVQLHSIVEDRQLKLAVLLVYAIIAQISTVIIAYRNSRNNGYFRRADL